MTRLVVMISGSGTNLQALIDAVTGGSLAADIVSVVSNKKAAFGLRRAEAAGIQTLYFPFKPYRDAGKSREEFDADLGSRVAALEPDLVVLAGWMRILTPAFLNPLGGRVINLHPAQPGQFAGTHAIERAFAAFGRGEIQQTGVMVHWVVPEVDAGPVIITESVPIRDTDTLATLEARVHQTEHRLIVEAVRRAAAHLSTRREPCPTANAQS